MSQKKVLDAIIIEKMGELTDAVRDLSAAKKLGDLSEIRAEQGRLGGAVRRTTSKARVVLTEKMLRELGIEATQTVAKHVMIDVFGRAASTADLGAHFAKTGRHADRKFVQPAMEKLQGNARKVGEYKQDYERFVERLGFKLDMIKMAYSSS